MKINTNTQQVQITLTQRGVENLEIWEGFEHAVAGQVLTLPMWEFLGLFGTARPCETEYTYENNEITLVDPPTTPDTGPLQALRNVTREYMRLRAKEVSDVRSIVCVRAALDQLTKYGYKADNPL